MGLVVALLTWACIARIDEAIPADGKLEPIDDAKKIQAPSSGVVKRIYVKNGDRVKAGDLLLKLESNIPQSQLSSLATTRRSLLAENRFYRQQISPTPDTRHPTPEKTPQLKIPAEILALTTSRTTLVAENRLYTAELNGTSTDLTPAQKQRLESNQAELSTRVSAGKAEIGQVEKQIAENQVKRQGLVDRITGIQTNVTSINTEIDRSGDSLNAALSQIDRQLAQNQAKITASQKTLVINQNILTNLKPAAAEGAIAGTQIQKQEQEIVTYTSELEQQNQERSRLQLEKERLVSTSKADAQRQQQRLQEQQQLLTQARADITQLDRERERLELSVNQSAAKLDNNKAINRKDLHAKIADNDKRIAEIDSQLNKTIVENDKRIAEIDNQITQAQQSLKYQEIKAPVGGEVFELKVYEKGVVNSNSADPLLQIIPGKDVIAKVFITNKDIGFVKTGQQVDVRIDTFNFSEFGDVKGTIEWIGSDALPPDQVYPFARFPAKIRLSSQSLTVKGVETVLKPGMSVKANIKLRDRTVISVFTDMFSKQTDGVKNLR
jgi:hemolysin D